MDAEELLGKLEAAVQRTKVGIELWLDSEEYARIRAEGVSFADWVSEIIDRA